MSHEGHTPPTQRGSARTLGASAALANPPLLRNCRMPRLCLSQTSSPRFVAALSVVLADDKEGENCEFEKHLPEANVVITTPFW